MLFYKKKNNRLAYSLDSFLLWAGVILLFILPFFLVYYLSGFFQGEIALKRSPDNSSTKILSPDELKEKAAFHAQKSEYREAIRFLYLAGLEHLKNIGALPEGTSLSDNENIRSLQKILDKSNEGFIAFLRLVLLFQEKWYGLKNCDADDYMRAQDLMKTIWRLEVKSHVAV